MMAALLRQEAARRFGGSALQRTQEEGRRLLPRRMYTTGELIPHGKLSPVQVQQKKDELYEILSKMENWRNRRLLMTLAVHVYPKTPTTQWHRLRASKWATNVASAVASGSFGIGACIGSDLLERKYKSSVAKAREFANALVK